MLVRRVRSSRRRRGQSPRRPDRLLDRPELREEDDDLPDDFTLLPRELLREGALRTDLPLELGARYRGLELLDPDERTERLLVERLLRS